MVQNDMYKVLSELESDELRERVADGSLSKEGYEITSKILHERGIRIPFSNTYEPRTYEPQNESFFVSIKGFYKEHPILSIFIFCLIVKVLHRSF